MRMSPSPHFRNYLPSLGGGRFTVSPFWLNVEKAGRLEDVVLRLAREASDMTEGDRLVLGPMVELVQDYEATAYFTPRQCDELERLEARYL